MKRNRKKPEMSDITRRYRLLLDDFRARARACGIRTRVVRRGERLFLQIINGDYRAKINIAPDDAPFPSMSEVTDLLIAWRDILLEEPPEELRRLYPAYMRAARPL